MIKLPYGLSDYEEIITDNYFYVDKTMYLEKLEDVGKRIVYLRPRRFGKTLFTSMMSYYYDVNSKDKFDNLFKNTYIYDNPTVNKNNYYVLKFDFSGMSIRSNDDDSVAFAFMEKIYSGIDKFLIHYNLEYEYDRNLFPAEFLGRFLNFFSSLKLDKKLYIIIDEYDNFTNTILSRNTDLFKFILGDDGFIKAFYALIKENTGTIIDRVFITGVCSVSLDAMTSGFNIATNITNDPWFNAMTALTHEEVKNLIKEIDSDNQDKIFNEMLVNYDGYKFNGHTQELVFNTTLVMYYLNYYLRFKKSPDELLDSNIISSYEQIKNIISLGDYKAILTDIYDNRIVTSQLKQNFDAKLEFNREEIISLLYYFGYLTIKDSSSSRTYNFAIPNKVMEQVYGDYYLSILSDYNINISKAEIDNILLSIRNEGKIDKLCSYISNLLKQADNRIYINLLEKDLQLMIYALLFSSNAIDVELEQRSMDNYIDIMIFKNEYCKYNIMIELKYLKKKESNRYDEVYNKAMEQITKYSEDYAKDNLKKYIVIFTGSDYTLTEV